MRLPRIGRPGAWFVLAVALAAGAFMLATGMGGSDIAMQRVLVAARPIAAGTLLDETADNLLATAEVPLDMPLTGLIASPDAARGRRLASAVGAGEPITQAALGGDPRIGPAPLAAGERAVPVPLRAAGAAAAAPPPGARVDVIASDGEGLAGRTRVVVSDAEVLSVMRADGADGDISGDAIVLRLVSADALEVARALDFAREVRVVARPAEEP
jgi:pilus assembly protein CpaB